VTLSAAATQAPKQIDYSALATRQTVKQPESAENRATEANETNQQKLTNASTLQLRSNYNTAQNQTANLSEA